MRQIIDNSIAIPAASKRLGRMPTTAQSPSDRHSDEDAATRAIRAIRAKRGIDPTGGAVVQRRQPRRAALPKPSIGLQAVNHLGRAQATTKESVRMLRL